MKILQNISNHTLHSKSRRICLSSTRTTRRWSSSGSHEGTTPPKLEGSAKLFADAAKEGTDATPSKSNRLLALEQQHSNWDGDESVQDAVLRMLVDKYKPLRTGVIRSADDKLKQSSMKLDFLQDQTISADLNADSMSHPDTTAPLQPSSGSWATEPLLPAIEGHQPWHTTFQPPSHNSSIKYASLMPESAATKTATTLPSDDKAKRAAKEKRRKESQGTRLNQARESTLDYRLGIKGTRRGAGRPNPTSIKGWTNLVEDRIERARQAGLFDRVKGRGKPLATATEERNPFIGREEFLMNRILQRNEASPPWVELQTELENAVQTLRQILSEAYTRRTIRILTLEYPDTALLSRLTLEDIRRHRDKEWIEREKSYHETALREINDLVRKYNTLAPYPVRRSLYTRQAEIERLPEYCAQEILQSLKDRNAEVNKDNGGSQSRILNAATSEADEGVLKWLQWLFRAIFR